MEHAVEAGTLANIPVMVDFGTNHPERPIDRPARRRNCGPATSIRTATPGCGTSSTIMVNVNPGMIEGRKRGVIFDVGHGGGSFRLADRGSGDQARLPAGFDLDRSAHSAA